MARNYRDRAELLRERYSDSNSAGALLYESAKQCINAVANQRGENPATTGAKIRALQSVADEERERIPNLMANWRAAVGLHIHADRLHLSDEEFREFWNYAHVFIGDMLDIYARRE